MIIEDDPDIQALLALHVRRTGAHVVVVGTGEEAVAAAATQAPALVLLDMQLPGIDGWGVLEALRARPDTAATPVVVVSIDEGPATESAEVQGWFVKPFQGRDIVEAVRRILPPSHFANSA